MVRKVYLFESKKIEGAFNVGYLHERFKRGRCKTFYVTEKVLRKSIPALDELGEMGPGVFHSVLSKERDELESYFEAHVKNPYYFSHQEVASRNREVAYLIAKNFAETIAGNLDRELVDNTCFGNKRSVCDC